MKNMQSPYLTHLYEKSPTLEGVRDLVLLPYGLLFSVQNSIS